MKITIAGMHCQACVARVRKALERVEGAQVDKVDVGSADVTIEAPRESLVLDAIRKAGYEPQRSE